jgi:hypothetical protein
VGTLQSFNASQKPQTQADLMKHTPSTILLALAAGLALNSCQSDSRRKVTPPNPTNAYQRVDAADAHAHAVNYGNGPSTVNQATQPR